MPQPGIHAVLALATRKAFSSKKWFALGLVFGSLIPDADGYVQTYGFLVQGLSPSAANELYHRTFSHSLFFALAMLLLFQLIGMLRRDQRISVFGLGLATGIAVLHTLPDIFIWFDSVGVLWPLWSVNLWEAVVLPELVSRLFRAANFLAFAWYLAYLASLARRAATDQEYSSRLNVYTRAQLVLGVVFSVLVFVLPASIYNIADGAVFLLFAFPNVLWVTWRMRATIETR